MIENEKQNILSEIKTLCRILITWGNTLVPNLDGKEVFAQERLAHFVERAQNEFKMSIEEIESVINQ